MVVIVVRRIIDQILLNMLLPDVIHILLLLLIQCLLVMVPLRDVDVGIGISIEIEIQIQIDLRGDSRNPNHDAGGRRRCVLRGRDDETSVLDIVAAIMVLLSCSMLEGVLVVRVVIVRLVVRVFAHARRDGRPKVK